MGLAEAFGALLGASTAGLPFPAAVVLALVAFTVVMVALMGLVFGTAEWVAVRLAHRKPGSR